MSEGITFRCSIHALLPNRHVQSVASLVMAQYEGRLSDG
jgi:hypothetical protein